MLLHLIFLRPILDIQKRITLFDSGRVCDAICIFIIFSVHTQKTFTGVSKNCISVICIDNKPYFYYYTLMKKIRVKAKN